MSEKDELYTSCIGCTQQFRHCGNPFRADTYSGCTFNCLYCFARARTTGNSWALNERDETFKIRRADTKVFEKMFKKCLEGEKEFKDINVEMMRHRVPLHLGGLADPFQHIEFTKHGGATKDLIELTNKYDYPMVMSTKVAHLPEDYWEILDPSRHAFQVSLIGYTEEFVTKYEKNTPTPQERLDFVKELHDRGFWVSIRIQPLIDIEEAKIVVEKIKDNVNYITIEHLKIALDNKEITQLFEDEFKKVKYYVPKTGARNYEVVPTVKREHFEIISKIANSYGVPVGCGDNDLHHLTQSRCCCGIDTIGEKFDNYMKFNTTYFMTGDYNLDEIWTPENLHRLSFVRKGPGTGTPRTVREWVKDFIQTNQHLIYASGKTDILKDMGIKAIQKKLW